MALSIGIDTGGTFTDLVGFDDDAREFVYGKQASTPDAPARALAAVLEEVGAGPTPVRSMVVGTTVATNAVLQRRGTRVLFVTTAGFEDVPFIGRIDKEELYNLHWKKPEPIVARRDCYGIPERVAHDGTILTPLTEEALDDLVAFVASRQQGGADLAVAVCLLFSYLRPEHEARIKDRLEREFPDLSISISHEVSPTWREYERSSTTIGDAYIKPVLRGYVAGVQATLGRLGIAAPASMLKSNGGHMRIETADAQPSQFLISGLAGGIVAARHYAGLAGVEHAFSLDMGGTSADIGTIQGGQERYLSEFQIGFGIPITVTCVDVATLGAGGGSIAWIDKGGLLQVGPGSAGAEPGPICYGKGGVEPTTTDANLVLGRLNPGYFLGGQIALDPDAPIAALRRIGEALGAVPDEAAEVAAHAIVETANENMANQIKLISVDRGLDPREFVLIPFGGAGPVHGSACARLLGIDRVLIPPHPGLSSAFGALAANWRVDRVWTIFGRSSNLDVEGIAERLEALTDSAVEELRADGYTGEPLLLRSIDMRYAGQNYEREIALPPGPFTSEAAEAMIGRFSRAHDEFYGFSLEGEPVEFVNLRISAIGLANLDAALQAPAAAGTPEPVSRRPVSFRGHGYLDTPVYRRETMPAGFAIAGPAIIEEPDSTTVVHPGDQLHVRPDGLLELRVG
ncbi:MAG: hydantoinase/oxoprolinase family protein [Thermomicrobiales bacterium]|nr:hydantoinase/oxoprolinase family protein [Thermomicrobiales bacterium]